MKVLDNSSIPVSDAADADPESDVRQGEDTLVVTGNMTVIDSRLELQEPVPVPEFHLQDRASGVVDMPGPVAPHAWSSTWAQARTEAARLQAEEERFSWMKDADRYMLSMGLEAVPWEQFAEAIS
jgi:hypothetical protein